MAVTINRGPGHSPPLSRFEILDLDLEPASVSVYKVDEPAFVEFLNVAKYLTLRRKHCELSAG